MSALYSIAEIRQIEHAAKAELPSYTLMQRAGEACARRALSLVAGDDDVHVLILAGPGNNGGDALEAAHYLSQFELHVSVALHADESRQPDDARKALQRARASEVEFLDIADPAHLTHKRWTLVIDGLFGIGQTRPLGGKLRACVDYINSLRCPVLAIDIASGLSADTGAIIGGAGCVAVRATHTLSFIGDKPGMHTCDGQDFSGEVVVDNLDIDDKHFPAPRAQLNELELFAPALKPRAGNTHKGSYGDVIVVGGAHGMGGAPVLAARMAAHAGSGRVFIAFVDDAPAYDSVHPELMMRQADRVEFGTASVVVGPGLGTSRHAHDVLTRALDAQGRIVIDADALNMIAAEPGLQHKLQNRAQHTSIITPHPLEAARLLDVTTAEIQNDRPAAARLLARHFKSIAILKGAGTVIAFPDGDIVINATGNPALSTAGTGDVLSGLCGALLAQGWPATLAALAAVWMHGKAADQLVDLGVGPVGLTASEVIPAVRTLLNQIIRDHAR
ncbi:MULTISPECIES: NAD(P)H-hydrate dehydratase [unclassified Herbaspirillum]|uniref:NAD(P)H-hydrate dehydratase n=1 Tax=unclassified Herbaspirillum TaxID=2624150 RepID=UPI000E2F8BDB|nr:MULTISPECIES: NAD(P)H-hydrate dehydratase [unclassified Herbaspirillum]RFB72973.1 NAD(P)H-hydrate dehydratase [Herbaspirillum sp. 3R-3a1]TFI11214.1 NAD(P)H-hydrate dehydratase [Herbaspirillum sp. 3R11]TFI17123.1 NAD(P)H-hydrate dehydratase [Herbaspirillum sp. 3R-11]TFI28922.1 NAD(P)H-hydrate dehydratase [Herbaspirillum sp. 3C11]